MKTKETILNEIFENDYQNLLDFDPRDFIVHLGKRMDTENFSITIEYNGEEVGRGQYNIAGNWCHIDSFGIWEEHSEEMSRAIEDRSSINVWGIKC